ncbi:MAG: aromatic amino acid transport family protein [Patescibacteria group bacterium]|nr:aromatic amino acid transport family protein [Patescibacteria group bacterium]
MKNFFYSISVLTGTIIGVGLFGLPYVTSKLGLFPTLGYFVLVSIMIITIQLVFGEIILRTKGSHRLPGYVGIYLGKRARILSIINNSIGLYGANLAYIILGGSFLASLLMPIFGANQLTYILIFFASGAFIIFLGSKATAKTELISLLIFFIALAVLVIFGLPHIDHSNFLTVDYRYWFFPYGLILFSLAGMSIIPEAREILGSQGKLLKYVIIFGTLIPAITYLIFIYLVLGVSGAATTEDALSGLEISLGRGILIFGYIFGLIATFTSYLTIGLTIKKVFWYDLKFNHFSAWIIACFVPMILYFIGLQNFIIVTILTGAVTMAIDGTMVFLVYLRARKKSELDPPYKMNLPSSVIMALIVMFLLGAAVTLWQI